MSRLVVVSNRVAVGQGTRGDTGGLAVALRAALEQHGGVWFGWSGKTDQRSRLKITEQGPIQFATVDLTQKDYDEYYNGFANRALWPLFHYRLDLAQFEVTDYDAYRRVNTLFARRLMPLLKPDDLIWIHDYHLIPLGSMLRQAGAKQKIGFFLHTPFPTSEVLTALPGNKELVSDLCAYDLLGFQTQMDRRAFRDNLLYENDGEEVSKYGLKAFGRRLVARSFPIGIDTDTIVTLAQRSERTRTAKRLERHGGEFAWLLGVDRLDYSKGIPQRFAAFERLLEKYPAYRARVRFLQIAPPSRSEVPEYKRIRVELETQAGRINGKFAELDWVPINFLLKSYSQSSLLGLYRAASVGLVTPLRDGMNLVAKEYVASQKEQDPGVLVLSRFAGAARELDAALIINPYDIHGYTDAIARAIEMPLGERQGRWSAMMDVLKVNTLQQWQKRFLTALRNTPT